MSDRSQALGTLLIEIADLAGNAEEHGIVGNPPTEVLAPLIEQARQLGVDVAPQAPLADLHLAVELAAQIIGGEAQGAARSPEALHGRVAVAKAGPEFAIPSPQVGEHTALPTKWQPESPDGET